MGTTTHTAQTLDRGLQVLEALARAEKDLTISEIADALKVHRTIGHRLVTTLELRDLVSRSAEGRYRLGAGLVRLAGAIDRDLRAIARPFLLALNSETHETVALAVLSRADVVYIDGHESSKALRVVARTGLTYPAHSTSIGKAILATLDDEAITELFPATRLQKIGPKTLENRAQLLGQLAAIRERGYATNIEEAEEGVASVAVAIIDHHGTTRAAVSVAAPLNRFTTAAIPRLAKAVQRTAKEIGERL
jgi:IclR family transcriptional regulator, acetate operon repressor